MNRSNRRRIATKTLDEMDRLVAEIRAERKNPSAEQRPPEIKS